MSLGNPQIEPADVTVYNDCDLSFSVTMYYDECVSPFMYKTKELTRRSIPRESFCICSIHEFLVKNKLNGN